MDHREYEVRRAELGQALRDLRWERRALGLIFKGTTDPVLIQAGCAWASRLGACDIELCQKIVQLDNKYQSGG